MSKIHSTAIIEDGAKVHPSVRVGAFSIIDSGAEIGENCVIESNARVFGFTKMGKNNLVCHGAIIGNEPQDLSYSVDKAKPLLIGDNNVFREKVDISHGIKEEHGTILGDNNYFMVSTHIGHDVIVGNDNIFTNNATIGGHVILGNGIYLSTHTAVHQFCKIGDLAMVSGLSGVAKDVPPFVMVDGHRASIVGLNVVGLRRAGFTPVERSAIKQAYKTIYKKGLKLTDAIDELALSEMPAPIKTIVDFIKTSTRGLVAHR